jgi:hypothetical protein
MAAISMARKIAGRLFAVSSFNRRVRQHSYWAASKH